MLCLLILKPRCVLPSEVPAAGYPEICLSCTIFRVCDNQNINKIQTCRYITPFPEQKQPIVLPARLNSVTVHTQTALYGFQSLFDDTPMKSVWTKSLTRFRSENGCSQVDSTPPDNVIMQAHTHTKNINPLNNVNQTHTI